MLLRMLRDSDIAGRHVKQYSTLESRSEHAVPYNPEIILLSAYPRKMKTDVHAKICM